MELRIVCSKCETEYRISDEKLEKKATKFACKKCGQRIVTRPGTDGIEVEGAAIKSPFEKGPPSQFGKFRDLKRLASGGMGDIYLAKLGGAEGFEREMVLKVLHPHLAKDKSFAQAMVDEAKLTVLLQHPNIVQMYNLERTGELLYCVLEFVPGKTLSAIQRVYRKKGGTIPLPMAIYIIAESLEGLGYAHELTDRHGEPRHIVHRDISPQNILITREGWVKIIDFGIAKAASRMTQTRPGMIKGKFAYMAPEQLKGESDHRADLFAMGITLWETLAGVRLFHSTTDVDTLQKVLHMEPPPIHLTHADIPKEMDAILARALDKHPEKRYQTAREFKTDLLQFMAPMTKEEMRATVDIEASTLGDQVIKDLPTGDVTSDLTPVADYGVVRKARAKPRNKLLIPMAAVLLAGLGAAAFFGLPLLTGPDKEQADGGTEKAGVVAEAPKDAGVAAAQPSDPIPAPADKPAEEPPKPADAGKKVAVVKPPKPKLPPAIKLAHEDVNKRLRRYGARLQNCADTHLTQESSGQDISLKLNFTIASTGRVTQVGLEPRSLESSKFGRCLISRVKRIKFPRHVDKSVSISFPLKFRVVKAK
jgi:serine/threonine-protein kinase